MTEYSSFPHTTQEVFSPPMQTAWEAVAAGFADSLGPLTIYESAQLIDAPWGGGEIEPEEDDGWGWDFEYKYEEQCRLEEERAAIAAQQAIAVRPEFYAKKPIPVQLRWAVFRRDDYRCVECGCDEDLTADHILAERNGGKATIGNLQTLCRPCNSRKGAR